MYTLNEYLPIFVGDDLPEKGWDDGMYCLETDRAKILRSNLQRGFVACFAFMLVDRGWMTIRYNGRSSAPSDTARRPSASRKSSSVSSACCPAISPSTTTSRSTPPRSTSPPSISPASSVRSRAALL